MSNMSNNIQNDFLQFFHKNYKKNWYNEERNFKTFFKTVENIAKKILKTDINKGLDMSNNNDIQWRKNLYGENISTLNSNQTFTNFLLISLDDFINKIIFCLSIIIIIMNYLFKDINKGYMEGILIMLSLIFYLLLMSWNDYNLYKKTLKLEEKKNTKKCKVIRNNKIQIISNKELLVGDILVINKGDIIEVDGFAITQDKIGVDESALFQDDDFKYKIQYKSSKFEYNKNNNEYICPFIFGGSYIIEGNGYLLVAALGKNIYKNGKIYFDMLNDKEENINNNNNNQDNKDNDFDEYEYYKEVGYYKINISFFSEKIASFGMCVFVVIGFILIVKDGILKKIENKSIISLDYLYDVLNIIIFILIGSLLAVPNSLNMIDFVSFLSDAKIMEKNNIDIKYKKYPELAHIDTLIIFDNNNIIENNKKEEISKVIKNIKNCGINIILVTDKDFEQSLVYGKELGIIDIWEFNNAQKIVNKYIELNKKKSICIESEFFNYLYGKIDIEQKNNGQKKVEFANIKYFKNLMANFKILSKVKNDDKLILLTGLRNMEQKICVVGATMDDISLLKMVNISFGMSTDVDTLKENYSLTLLDNSFIAFWKSYILSCNLNYKINQYMDFFTITFYTSLIINIIGLFYCKNTFK